MIALAYFGLALLIFIVLEAHRAYHDYGSAVAFECIVMHAFLAVCWPAMIPYWFAKGIGKLLRKVMRKK